MEFGAGDTATLAGAFRAVSGRHFPPAGRAPALFDGPQYTPGWRCPTRPTQRGVLDYVRGLASLIPESIAQGLIGHPFVCPDMIGGGDLAQATTGVDQELFVRYAQLAALPLPVSLTTIPWFRRG